MTYKSMMGLLSVLITLIAYGIYLWQATRSRGVQPHPFSWLLWGVVTGVVYLVQRSAGGAAGSWASGLTAIICLVISAVSFTRNRWHFSLLDWLFLGAGLVVFGYYLVAKDHTVAAILATLTDVIGYGSTIKKGWREPHKDSVSSFALNSAKFVPALFALGSYSVATYLYPGTLVVVNGGVALMLILRRYYLGNCASE